MSARVLVGRATAAAIALGIASWLLAGQPGVTTIVTLVGQDTERARLALPSIEVRVDGPEKSRAGVVAAALANDLAARAITRERDKGEVASYALAVLLFASQGTDQKFEARLVTSEGDVVWIAEGLTRSEGGPVAEAHLASLADNLLSALLRDGWLQARYDPNDPPPPPPAVGREEP